MPLWSLCFLIGYCFFRYAFKILKPVISVFKWAQLKPWYDLLLFSLVWYSWRILEMGQAGTYLAVCPTFSDISDIMEELQQME